MTAIRHFVTACRDWQLRPLVTSMLRHCQPFKLHVLAWDWTPGSLFDLESADGPQRWPGTEVDVTIQPVFLARHPELRKLPGEPRSSTDTVCSVRWSFVLDVMRQTGQPVTLIDGDLWFWSSPEPVFDEIGSARCAASPHGFAPASAGLPGVTLESHGKYGRYNGGWVYFADPVAAEFMANAARAWCYTGFLRLASGRELFGDQGHLEVMAEEFGAHAIRNPGLNVGPWNVNRWRLTESADGLRVDDLPLIAYHFSSLRWNPDGSFAQLFNPEYAVSVEAQRLIYDPYLAEINAHRP